MSIDTPANPPVDAFEAALSLPESVITPVEETAPESVEVIADAQWHRIKLKKLMRIQSFAPHFAAHQVSGSLFTHTLVMRRRLKPTQLTGFNL